MLLLTLIATASSILLDGNFKIEFNPNCTQFFVLRGIDDYIYLYKEENKFILWHTKNDSYVIFSHPWNDPMVFKWPSIINDKNMQIILSQGEIDPPFQFDEEQILCEYYGLSTGSMTQCSTKEYELIDCEQTFSLSLQYLILFLVTVITGIAIVAAALGNYGYIKILLQSLHSRIIQHYRNFLSRNREDTPPPYQETSI